MIHHLGGDLGSSVLEQKKARFFEPKSDYRHIECSNLKVDNPRAEVVFELGTCWEVPECDSDIHSNVFPMQIWLES